MAAIGLALAALVVGDARQQQLIGIELGVSLGDALALLVQQLGQRFRFGSPRLARSTFTFARRSLAIFSSVGTRSAISRSTNAWMRATAIAGAARASRKASSS